LTKILGLLVQLDLLCLVFEGEGRRSKVKVTSGSTKWARNTWTIYCFLSTTVNYTRWLMRPWLRALLFIRNIMVVLNVLI